MDRTNEQRSSSEESLSSREINVTAREAIVSGREDAAALREEALRAREEAAQARSELDALMGQLREANEHLVLANLRAQTLAEAAQVAVRARDEFLSMASHELFNPVNAIQLQLVGILREAERQAASLSQEWVSQRVGQARDQVSRLECLVGTLLDVTRIRAGRLHLELEDLDFGSVVQATVNRFRRELKDRHVTVRLTPVTGRSDRLRLDQVVTNLLSNAIKYGEGHSIEISLETEADMVRLSVTDHGIGIAQENHERIFEPFERTVSRRQYGGFGLGLWITHQIVEAMGGHISVDSRPDQGSTFSVVVPRTLSPASNNPPRRASPDED